MRKKIFIMLTKSPNESEENNIRLNKATKGDIVLFSQDSVFAFTNNNSSLINLIKHKISDGVDIYASQPDCSARGVNIPDGVKSADYSKQVDLLCEWDLSY